MNYTILALSGSLRKNATNTGLLRAFERAAPAGITFVHADISELPLFSEDVEAGCYPKAAEVLKEQIQKADGVLIATPEYNRGTSAALKNALDWSTRPEGTGVWTGKPVYIVGASSGTLGTVNAQYDLKRTMLYLRAALLGQPEFYVTFNKKKFTSEGELTDEDTKAFVAKALAGFIEHIEKVR